MEMMRRLYVSGSIFSCERAMFDQGAKLQTSVRSGTGESVKLKVAWNKKKEMGQAHQGLVDERGCEWMTFKMLNGATHPKLEPHAGACDDLCSSARH